MSENPPMNPTDIEMSQKSEWQKGYDYGRDAHVSDDAAAALRMVEAVKALHASKPYGVTMTQSASHVPDCVCSHCSAGVGAVPYPCVTVQAMHQAEATR